MLEPGGAGHRPETSDHPQLFRAPAGRHQASDDGRSIAGVGYEAGGLIVPSRRPGADVSRLRSAAAARLEPGTSKARLDDFFTQQNRQQQLPGVALSKFNASSNQVEAAQSEAPTEPTLIWGE